MAETCALHCALHTACRHRATFISAHFCAVIPTVHILRVKIEDVPWKYGLVTVAPRIEHGQKGLSIFAGRPSIRPSRRGVLGTNAENLCKSTFNPFALSSGPLLAAYRRALIGEN